MHIPQFDMATYGHEGNKEDDKDGISHALTKI